MLQYTAVHKETRAANFKDFRIIQPIGHLLWTRPVEYHDEEASDLALTQLHCISVCVVGNNGDNALYSSETG